MPAGRRRTGCGLLAAALAVLVLVCAVGATVVSTAADLGQPSPDLSPVDRNLLGLYLFFRSGALDRPAGDPAADAILDIEPGDDAASVAGDLDDLGILHDRALFLRYLRFRGLDTGIEAGRYHVSGAMTPRELADLLQQATSSRYTLTIPEGWRREQVAQALGDLDLGFSAGDFLAATRAGPPAWVDAPTGASTAEGFLFPDTYVLDPRMTAGEVFRRFLDTFDRRVDPEVRDEIRTRGLTVYEAVTLASIIDREAIDPSERPLIASVFLNRLDLGIPLQADPTVQFALGLQDDGAWWKPALTADDLQVNSPYNTYVVTGLPPGPIASPGMDSLRAVARAPDTAFLFFRAACDGSGSHQFAETFEEHLANACP